MNKLANILLLACLLITAGCCSSHDATARSEANESTQGISTRAASSSPGGSANNLDFALTNSTGTTLQAVYISPTDSPGWEENVLGGDKLEDGGTVNIKFNSEERASLWDLRVEGSEGRYAEWKSINLSDISRITLHIKLDKGTAVVAEVE